MQWGAMITQDNRPIAFFRRKLSKMQTVETLKEKEENAVGTIYQSLY
jgi:hypothetical protein